MLVQHVHDLIERTFMFVRVISRRTEDRPSSVLDPTDGRTVEWSELVGNHASPSMVKSKHLIALS
jgi:hypothetical protein